MPSESKAFREWWNKNEHGWKTTNGEPDELSEFKLAKDVWDAALRFAIDILGTGRIYEEDEDLIRKGLNNE